MAEVIAFTPLSRRAPVTVRVQRRIAVNSYSGIVSDNAYSSENALLSAVLRAPIAA
jgi:mitochondrial fission protein ELM1